MLPVFKNYFQYFQLLDKSELETVAKALSSGCWTLSDSGDIEISDGSGTSGVCGNSPKLTLAQGNVRPVTQASGECVTYCTRCLLSTLQIFMKKMIELTCNILLTFLFLISYKCVMFIKLWKVSFSTTSV